MFLEIVTLSDMENDVLIMECSRLSISLFEVES